MKPSDGNCSNMKVNDPNLTSASSAGTSRTNPTDRTSGNTAAYKGTSTGASDDVHLSELVRSLRALAPTSPERQAHLEQIARSYAQGSYNVDAEATAGKIVDDALRYS